MENLKRRFTYSEVLRITNRLEKSVGEGGFGKVYHGHIGDTQVAVKMLSATSTQGYREFETEASYKYIYIQSPPISAQAILLRLVFSFIY